MHIPLYWAALHLPSCLGAAHQCYASKLFAGLWGGHVNWAPRPALSELRKQLTSLLPGLRHNATNTEYSSTFSFSKSTSPLLMNFGWLWAGSEIDTQTALSLQGGTLYYSRFK